MGGLPLCGDRAREPLRRPPVPPGCKHPFKGRPVIVGCCGQVLAEMDSELQRKPRGSLGEKGGGRVVKEGFWEVVWKGWG